MLTSAFFHSKKTPPLAEKQNSTTNRRSWTLSSHNTLQSHTGQETRAAYLRTSHSPLSAETLGQLLERSSSEFAELLVVGLGPFVSLFRGFVVDVRRWAAIVIWVFFHHLQLGFDGTDLCINTLNSRGKGIERKEKSINLLIQSKWVTFVNVTSGPFGKGMVENENKNRKESEQEKFETLKKTKGNRVFEW